MMALRQHLNILVTPQDSIRRAFEILDAAATQIALVVDESGCLLGTVTDGDIRRGILRGMGLDKPVVQVMNDHPVTAQVGTSRDDLMALMISRSVKQLPLVDDQGRVAGLERLDRLLQQPVLKDNPVIILAGGQGARLRPLTLETPKPLLKIGGKPVLEHILNQLRVSGFHKVFISVHYLGDRVEDYFGDGQNYGVSIEYLKEPEPLGTAGSLSLMPPSLELPCLVINGDLVTKVNFEHFLEFHQERGFRLTVGVKEYTLQIPFGVVTTKADRVVDIQEKPTEVRLINAGVYVLDPSVFDLVPKASYFDMTQLMTMVIRQGEDRVGAFLIHEYWMDIGTAADYNQAQLDYPSHFPEL